RSAARSSASARHSPKASSSTTRARRRRRDTKRVSNHTTGPWHIHEEETEDGEHTPLVRDEGSGELTYHVVNEDGEPVAVLAWPRKQGEIRTSPLDNLEQLYANALLMAKAPDLYYVADSAIGALKQIRDGNIDEDGWAFVDELIEEFAKLQVKVVGEDA